MYYPLRRYTLVHGVPRTELSKKVLAILCAVYFAMFSSWAGVNVINSKIEAAPDVSYSVSTPPAAPLKPTFNHQAAQSFDNTVLQQYLQTWVNTHSTAQWGIAIKELGSAQGQQAAVNQQAKFGLASIYKLYVARYLSSFVPPQRWSTTTVPGLTPSQTYQQCLDVMIRLSDNACGEAVANVIGWSRIQRLMVRDGFIATTLNRTDSFTGSAQDVLLYLEKLQTSDGFDASTKQQLVASMQRQRFTAGIPAGCSGCQSVMNKTGDFAGNINDAALITVHGKTYALVIMSSGSNWKQVAELTRGIVASLPNAP